MKIIDIRHKTPRTNGTRPLSRIKNIARHHSATEDGSWESFWPHWKNVKKWGTGGYHEIILRDGTIQLCYDPEEITNGVGGQNSYIYHICVVGNGSFTAAQERAFEERARYWMTRFNLPVSAVKGHREFPGANTTCPGIDMNLVRARLASGNVTHAVAPAKSAVKAVTSVAWHVELGDKGGNVKQMQRDLTALGYPLADDGSFGYASDAALRAFQKAQGLAVDGKYGPGSQAAVKKALDAKKKPAPKPKPSAKRTIYRVIIDGKQVGAYGENDNALREARKAIEKGATNIRIEKV